MVRKIKAKRILQLRAEGLSALQDSGCKRGLNPPVSSNDRAI